MIAVISIFAAFTGSFILYRIQNYKKLKVILQSENNRNISILSSFLINKIAGFVILGFIPGLLILSFFPQNPDHFGLTFGQNKIYWYFFAIPVLIIWINYFLANNPRTFNRYPEMRFEEWTKSRLTLVFIGWAIYLLGYEFLFRGLLFFSVYHSHGLFVSIAVNTFIYSLVHIPKGKDEMIGAIPFGILLCYMSLLTESIILPFLIHLSLAISTDIFSIYYNPKMKFIRS